MTKIPGKWKDAESGQFIILRRLADGSKLPVTAFETSRRRVGFDEPVEERNGDTLPHSSALKRLDELTGNGSVKEFRINGKKHYQLTFYGFIKLLALSHGRGFFPDIMEHITEYFFLLKAEFNFLIPPFSKRQLFDTFTAVCKNTNIEINLEVKNRAKKYNMPTGGVPGTVYLDRVEWAHQYILEMQVQQFVSKYLLTRNITIYGRKEEMMKKTEGVRLMVYGLITGAFYYELLMRCSRFDREFDEYDHDEELREIIIKRIGKNKILLFHYLEFVNHLVAKHKEEGAIMNKLEKSLSAEKIPKIMDPWIRELREAYDHSLRI